MPFELNSATGEWEWVGDQPDDDAAVAVAEPPAAPAQPAPDTREPAPEAERENRPWYEKFVGRYNPLFGGIDNLKNDIEYEVKQFSNPETALPRLTNLMVQKAASPLPGADLLGGGTNLGNTASLGGFRSQANIQKAALDLKVVHRQSVISGLYSGATSVMDLR